MKSPARLLVWLTLAACGEPIQPPAVSETLPFAPRPGIAAVGDASYVLIEVLREDDRTRLEYTDVVLDAKDGRALRVERRLADGATATLARDKDRLLDEKGVVHFSFEEFEELLPRRAESVPRTWSHERALAFMHRFVPAAWDENGGLAECEFEEILLQKERSTATVKVHYRDTKREMEGRLVFDLQERRLTGVVLEGGGLKLRATRRATTVK